jgi:hypothetical protein
MLRILVEAASASIAARSTGAHRGVLREISDIDQGKKSNDEDRTDDQHTQHRPAEKTPSRLDRRLNDTSTFFMHETASYDLSIHHAGVLTLPQRRQSRSFGSGTSKQHMRCVLLALRVACTTPSG